MISAKLWAHIYVKKNLMLGLDNLDEHDNEHCAYGHTLHAAPEYGVGNHGKRLVRYHVGQEQRDKQAMPVLSNGSDPVRIFSLLPNDF